MGSVEGAGVYEEGATATLTATANAGYEFVGWVVGADTLTANPLELVVDADITVEAVFAALPLPEYTVSVTVDPVMGSVEGAGVYNEGATATLSATANAGYQFVNWTVDGEEYAENPLYWSVDKDVTVVANFKSTVTTDAENATGDAVQAEKIMRDGHLYILRAGDTYTTAGARVE